MIWEVWAQLTPTNAPFRSPPLLCIRVNSRKFHNLSWFSLELQYFEFARVWTGVVVLLIVIRMEITVILKVGRTKVHYLSSKNLNMFMLFVLYLIKLKQHWSLPESSYAGTALMKNDNGLWVKYSIIISAIIIDPHNQNNLVRTKHSDFLTIPCHMSVSQLVSRVYGLWSDWWLI